MKVVSHELSGSEQALRRSASTILDAIARDLNAWLGELKDAPAALQPRSLASIAEGSGGVALFFHERAAITRDPRDLESASEALDCMLRLMSEQASGELSLFGGIAGMGWLLQELSETPSAASLAIDTSVGGGLSTIDEVLLEAVARTSMRDTYDLITGLTGIGLYGIRRSIEPSGALLTKAVVARLRDLAVVDESGVCWQTPPMAAGPRSEGPFANGLVDLGLAHGVSGTITFLAEVVRSGLPIPHAKALLMDATRWLLSQGREGALCPSFPHAVVSSEVFAPTSRLAWCTGDLSVASALMAAARATGNDIWRRIAVAIATNATLTPPHLTGVVDASICHGAAGIAHIFSLFSSGTGLPQFARAAAFWFNTTLRYHQPGAGTGGYTYGDIVNGARLYVPRIGLVEGAAGIGLALMALQKKPECTWDQLFGLASVCA